MRRDSKFTKASGRRRLGLIEILEKRQLLAVDVCEPFTLAQNPSPAASVANVTSIFDSPDAGAGLYVPLDAHDEHDHLMDLDPSHPLRNSQWGYGSLNKNDGALGDRGRNGGGAAPNLQVTNTLLLRDADGSLVDSVPIGQLVAIQVNFATEGIPAGTVFNIRLMMDGVPIDYTADWAIGSGNWYVWWTGWYAGPGEHTLDVVLDSNDQLAETDETDNSQQQIFSPYQATDFPQKLIFPIDGVRNQDYAINNYADVDPRANLTSDFTGGIFQYDGHNAWDVGPANFLAQDQGIPILAAADGVVAEVADGNFDRKTSFANTNANYVIVDHGNNWRTIYWHLARDSVVVSVGQSVSAGDMLGEMGSSGISTGTHVHYSVYRYNFPVESMYDTETYYLPHDDVEYQPLTETGLLYSNINNDNTPSNSDWRESFPTKSVYTLSSNDPVVLNFSLSHLVQNDLLDLTIYRPDGSIAADWDWTANGLYRFPGFYWWIGTNYWQQQVGDWNWQVAKDGEVLVSEWFEVVDGVSPGQIRMMDAGGNNVNPGRTTPFDFGSGAGSQQSFSIQNHGDSPLILGTPAIPMGFSVVGAFPSSVGAGATANFTLQFDNAFFERSFGTVRFTTSDPDVAVFVFNVEGTGIGAAGSSFLDFPGPAVAYELGAAETFIDPTAVFQNTGAQAARFDLLLQGDFQSGDALQIANEGTAAGEVGVVGSDVSYGGTVVATIEASGPTSDRLSLVFNEFVTTAAINAILRRITFQSTSEVAVPRFLRGMVLDINGQSSTHAYKGVRVHEPVLTLARVESIEINAGETQRSRVDSTTVTFSNVVELGSGAFELIKQGAGGGNVTVNVSTEVIYGQTVATLTFAGPLTQNGSLMDGNYELRMVASQITDARGNALDGDEDGTMGGDRVFGNPTDEFFRLFGDSNGDRTVTLSEFNQFRSAFGKSEGQAGYRADMDFESDGAIGLSDFNAFRSRFGSSV